MYAGWCSGCDRMKQKFYDECRSVGMRFEVVDVEDPQGVEMSIKFGVRNVPTLIFFEGNREIGRAHGNESYLKIKDYI
jgi:thiol-disulfide isomerase/thioredoxin